MELAAIIDWGDRFVRGTYKLEGDGPLAFTCYETMSSIFEATRVPNVQAVSQKLANQKPGISTQQLVTYAKKCIQPGLYISKCANTDENFCVVKWWQKNSTDVPSWASAAKKVLLVQPSSAASERVFSLLNNSFHDQQDLSLQDYIEASLMLQYNYRK